MEKEKVKVEQLVAGLLLKFGKLDEFDLSLLIKDINKVFFEEAYVELDYESENYYVMSDGTIILNPSYIKQVYKNINNNLLERTQGSVVKKCLDNLDIANFVLRKIKLMGSGCVVVDDLNSNFSVSQIGVMTNLYADDFIVDYVHKDVLYGDYSAIKLTQKGEVSCFLSTYSDEVAEFARILERFRYDSALIPEFLMTQNLSKPVQEILMSTKFLTYCCNCGKSPYIEGMDPYVKKRVPNTN